MAILVVFMLSTSTIPQFDVVSVVVPTAALGATFPSVGPIHNFGGLQGLFQLRIPLESLRSRSSLF